ncbi:MAG: outer membrane beta-barrel protein [Saprospiraceae bacterium]
MKKFTALLFSLIAGFFTTISAQEVISMRSQTMGISVGAAGGYLSFRDDVAHPLGAESGPGFGGHIQYGFSHRFSGVFAVQNYFVTAKSENKADNSYPYLEADLSAMFNFGSTNSQLRPMLAVGGTFTKVSESYYNFSTGEIQDEVYSGIGFVGGAGLSYFIKPELSVDLNFQIHSGAFSKTLVDRSPINVQHSYYTFNGLLGLSYHF